MDGAALLLRGAEQQGPVGTRVLDSVPGHHAAQPHGAVDAAARAAPAPADEPAAGVYVPDEHVRRVRGGQRRMRLLHRPRVGMHRQQYVLRAAALRVVRGVGCGCGCGSRSRIPSPIRSPSPSLSPIPKSESESDSRPSGRSGSATLRRILAPESDSDSDADLGCGLGCGLGFRTLTRMRTRT